MLGQAWSASLQGVEGVPIRVEAQVSTGIPGLFIVGLPRGAVREGRDRIQSALRNLPGASDALRVTINLAPADLMKDGSALDLAMAVALLGGAELVPASSLAGTAFVGELGLDGRLHPVRGVLPLALGCV
jgi:magnesium chelatase family protein